MKIHGTVVYIIIFFSLKVLSFIYIIPPYNAPPPETRFNNAFQQFCTKLQNSIGMDIKFVGYLRIGI